MVSNIEMREFLASKEKGKFLDALSRGEKDEEKEVLGRNGAELSSGEGSIFQPRGFRLAWDLPKGTGVPTRARLAPGKRVCKQRRKPEAAEAIGRRGLDHPRPSGKTHFIKGEGK